MQQSINAVNYTDCVETVTIKCKLRGKSRNAMLDSGAGAALATKGPLDNAGMQLRPADKTLVDASGNNIRLLGMINIPVEVFGDDNRRIVKNVTFYVSDSDANCVLLGRNFMKAFGKVCFDFDANKVQLGDMWCTGLKMNGGRAKLAQDTVIPPKSEAYVKLKWRRGNGMVSADFIPNKVSPCSGLHAIRSRVLPDSKGEFFTVVVNTTNSDICLKKNCHLGKLTARLKTVAVVDSDTSAENSSIDWEQARIGDLPDADKEDILNLLKEYEDVFARNSKKPRRVNNATHEIDTGQSRPVFRKPYQIPYAYTEEFDRQVKEMLENEIIRPSKSPWNAPVILVKKKDGSLRFVCDFRALNDVTIRDTYPLPKICEVIDRMEGATYFTTLDCAAAYWSIPLEESDKEKTAFSGPRGKYEFNVTPFGLCNAGATYQRMMDLSLSGLSTLRILAYLDDIALFSSSLAEHKKQLRELLECLRRCNISLNLPKCAFAMQEVDFLGYSLSAEGIKPQKRLTEAIRTYPRPNNRKELKRFLGMSNYYRNFIPMFADIAAPLNALTSAKVAFTWNEDCEQSFKKLKDLLCSHPVLAFPMLGEKFVLEVDASDFAIGGVLLQTGADGSTHPVAYYSNALKPAERGWSPYTKEAKAIIMGTRHWKAYLAGSSFVIRSDHNPLSTLRKTKDPRGKFPRWLTELEELSFEIEYKPGKLNVVPDALSRINTPEEYEPEDDLDDKIYSMFTDGTNFQHQLHMEQQKDPTILDAMEKISAGVRIESGRLRHIQRQLRVENELLTKNGRPIVPASLRKFVLEQLHEGGHFGAEKLYERIQKRFYWPNLYRYVTTHASLCETCQRCKPSNRPPRAPLLPVQVPELPMHFITIDVAYMTKDEEGFRYILLIGDLFSKYVSAVPLREQTAEEICDALHQEWLLIHGNPNFLLSDQGSNVDGNVVREICSKFGIEKRRTTAYHSQGNGFAERSIRNVKEIFRTHLLANKLHQNQWRSVLKELVFALNTTLSSATKCVPYDIVHGRTAIIPEDVKLGLSRDQLGRDILSAKDFAEEVKLRLTKAFGTVGTNLDKYRKQMESTYNKSTRLIEHSLHDRVWVRNKTFKAGESAKLAPRRSGPWEIIEIKPNGRNFRLKNCHNGRLTVVHHDRIEPIRSDSVEPRADDETSDDESSDDGYMTPDSEPAIPNAEPANQGDDPPAEERRYPLRERTQRNIPGAIPWDAVPLR